MAIYKPSKERKKVIEDILRDLDPATRELARAVLENIMKEEETEISKEELFKRISELKKKRAQLEEKK
ncbi:MAG: hypothetical protein QXE10_05655 [Desulfurococcaceae archaeon]|jgi:uncharacterized protein (UPF0305 family)